MSTTHVYIIGGLDTPRDSDPEEAGGYEGLTEIAGLKNSHGYHMAIWRHAWEQSGRRDPIPLFGDGKDLWALSSDPRMAEHLRIAHASTFDRAIITRENVGRVADALETTAAEIDAAGRWSHLAEVARLIRATPLPEGARGFGLDTSLSDVWLGYLSDGNDGFDLLEAATVNEAP